jgi:hypothetical protein
MSESGHEQKDNETALEEPTHTGVTAAADGGPAEAVAPADGAALRDLEAPPGDAVEIDERRAKMERLRAEGIDPYPHLTLWRKRTRIADVLAAHDPAVLEPGAHPDLRYEVAGRIIARRGHGKTAFLDIRDLSG